MGFIEEPGGLWARVWNPDLFSEEGNDNFDDEEYGEEFLLVEDIIGFDCVVQKDAQQTEEDGQPKWDETWDTSNCVPYRVKITLRVVEIPVWKLSQKPFSLDSAGKGRGRNDSNSSGTNRGGSSGGSRGQGGGSGGMGGGGRGGMGGGGPGGMGGGGPGGMGGGGPMGPMR